MTTENGKTSPTNDLEGLVLNDSLEGTDGGALEDDHPADICTICENKMQSPKILSCLHEFCEGCLQEKLKSQKSEENINSPSNSVVNEWSADKIDCPVCSQKTNIPEKGISALQSDTVLENLMSKDEEKQIGCTSCTTGDNAVARCKTCENLLCPNCVTAHQFMRCFEDHNVVSFEDMVKNGESIGQIKKPIFCDIHTAETLKLFCCSCTMPICTECAQKYHMSATHVVKDLVETMESKRVSLKELAKECGNKLNESNRICSNTNTDFEELEMQKDNTRGHIEETFQSYKVVLEEVKDAFLKELDELHEKRELCLMERLKKMENYENQLTQAKSFAERVIEHGTAGQLAQLFPLILGQLNSLFSGFNMPNIPVNAEFKTDATVFKTSIKKGFGQFAKGGASTLTSFEPDELTLPMMSLDNPPFMHGDGNQGMLNLGMNRVNSMALSGHQGLESISNIIQSQASMNIHHGDAISGNNSPLSDSGISVGNVSHSSGNAAMMNAAAMAKLHQSQSPLFAPGMSIGSSSSVQTAITSGAGDNGLVALIPSSSHISTSGSNSVQTANIEGLASLLNQPPPSSQVNTFSGIGTFDQFTTGNDSVSPDSVTNEPYPPVRRTKMNPMQIRFKFGQLGPGKGQFNSPHGFCLGLDEDIVVADTNNHRIQVFLKSSEFKYQFGIPGREEGQLWYPRKVAVIFKTGKFVVCDRGNERSRMQIFNRNGHFLRKIAIRYIDIVAGLAITPEGHIVAVDSVSPTVFCISETGDLIKWFDCSDYMREPSDIAIHNGEYYVCDFKGHCVVVFNKDGAFLRRIGCENITNFPNGIDISDAGDVLIGDSHGNRFHVGVFQIDGSLVSEFQCPYVKVSRCCGLKITLEGYIVTLAKNNHHVLVLNTLYIP